MRFYPNSDQLDGLKVLDLKVANEDDGNAQIMQSDGTRRPAWRRWLLATNRASRVGNLKMSF
jgi:hypothetical protein